MKDGELIFLAEKINAIQFKHKGNDFLVIFSIPPFLWYNSGGGWHSLVCSSEKAI